ncbi:MAG TPA: DNA repair protein RecN [Clostridiales bacterium]|nr:DNA repair protein RecN [Clostridiales bacterium]
MLARIEINDFALIEKAVLTPGSGLLILTGETGAGKSILIDAIGALSGSKVGRDVIRHGQSRAMVEAVFTEPSHDLPDGLLTQLGLAGDDPDEDLTDELILSREIQASGKSVCRVNGRLVALSVLRDISSYLIDIHGQHDQQAIFRTETHLSILDRYAGDPVSEATKAWQMIMSEFQTCLRQLNALGQDPAERARRVDMLRYQIQEIEAARPKTGEDDRLAQRRKIVANAEKITIALSEACELLNGDSSVTILTSLARVANRIEPATALLPELAETACQIRENLYALQNAAAELRDALEHVECDPGELEKIDERLDQLFRLKKKYGGTLEAVLQFHQQARQQLDDLADGEAQFEKLTKQKDLIRLRLIAAGRRLSALRRSAAEQLEQHIARELGDLGMKGIRFAVSIEELSTNQDHYAGSGLDKIEFLISANPGEPLKPLIRIASGGEASRIMLAIKSILAEADRIPVLIFDEIDTGVSGRTASRVADKLSQLSRHRQIFCITHLAQIAAMADQHLLIEKISDEETTRTQLTELDADGRKEELARLLSGGVGDQTARQLASQLLENRRI